MGVEQGASPIPAATYGEPRWVPVLNGTGGTIDPHSCVRVTSVDANGIYTVGQPDEDQCPEILVTGAGKILASGYGLGTFDFPAVVRYYSLPAIGANIGAVQDQYEMGAAGDGFTVVGLDTGNGLAVVVLTPAEEPETTDWSLWPGASEFSYSSNLWHLDWDEMPLADSSLAWGAPGWYVDYQGTFPNSGDFNWGGGTFQPTTIASEFVYVTGSGWAISYDVGKGIAKSGSGPATLEVNIAAGFGWRLGGIAIDSTTVAGKGAEVFTNIWSVVDSAGVTQKVMVAV